MKIVYMGTPDFAVAPLAALVENGYEVEAVLHSRINLRAEARP